MTKSRHTRRHYRCRWHRRWRRHWRWHWRCHPVKSTLCAVHGASLAP